ncbi:MAG: hypothetical protein ACI4ET_10920 [Bilifractor sp.]
MKGGICDEQAAEGGKALEVGLSKLMSEIIVNYLKGRDEIKIYENLSCVLIQYQDAA